MLASLNHPHMAAIYGLEERALLEARLTMPIVVVENWATGLTK